MPTDITPFGTSTGRRIRSDERVLVVGKTGSGKTFLVQHWLAPVPRLVVFDPKGRIKSDDWKLRPFEEVLEDLRNGKPGRGRIPPQLRPEAWEPYLWECYNLDNVIVYIDELYGVGPARGSEGLQALYTRGREKGIGVWSAAQRPAFIPTYAKSEAEWIIQFQLNVEDDRDRMYQAVGKKAYIRLHDHQFLVYNDSMNEPALFERLDVGRTEHHK